MLEGWPIIIALSAHEVGAQVVLLSIVTDDHADNLILEELKREDLSTAAVGTIRDPDRNEINSYRTTCGQIRCEQRSPFWHG